MKEVKESVMLPEGCEMIELNDMREIEGGWDPNHIYYLPHLATKTGALAHAVAHKKMEEIHKK